MPLSLKITKSQRHYPNIVAGDFGHMFPNLLVFLVLISHIDEYRCTKEDHVVGDVDPGEVGADCQPSHQREMCKSEANQPNMAVVVYDESVISPFHIEKRSFQFGDIQVDISQDWKNAGVAAVVWDAAVVLGEYVERHRSVVKDLSVLELGAGTGLAGIVAALSGGRVTITDRAVALDILRKNVNLNRERNRRDGTPQELETRELDVEIKELEWGKDLQTFTPYRVVLGADIIYIEETFDDLLQTFLRVCDAQTRVLLSCKIRYARDSRFLTMMEQHFTVTEIYFEKRRDIHIYECIKR